MSDIGDAAKIKGAIFILSGVFIHLDTDIPHAATVRKQQGHKSCLETRVSAIECQDFLLDVLRQTVEMNDHRRFCRYKSTPLTGSEDGVESGAVMVVKGRIGSVGGSIRGVVHYHSSTTR